MDLQLQRINEQQKQLQEHNEQLQRRAEKFGSAFTLMNLQQFRKFKIKKASETGKMAYLQDVLLTDIKDNQKRIKTIEQRKNKFFPEIKVNLGGNFDKKEDIDFTQEDVKIRDNTWYLYGVDYMSNQKIRNYFKANPHFKIEWLNDSSCNIVFNTAEQAVEAIKPHVRATAEQDEFSQTWYQLQDYEVDGVKRQLLSRLATNKDVKNTERTGHDSEYYKWLQNKKKFHKYIKGRAYDEIKKTKHIVKREKDERNLNIKEEEKEKQKAKKEEESESSSGVESQSESDVLGEMK